MTTLRFLQYNIGSGITRLWAALAHFPDPGPDVALLQDTNDLGPLGTDGWTIFPSEPFDPTTPSRRRAVILIRRRSHFSVQHIDTLSTYSSAVLLSIRTTSSPIRIVIFSVYTPPAASRGSDEPDTDVRRALELAASSVDSPDAFIVAGDFNARNGPWEPAGSPSAAELSRATRLCDMFGAQGMICETPPNTVTNTTGRGSTIDLLFSTISPSLYETYSTEATVDHLCIAMIFCPRSLTATPAIDESFHPTGPYQWHLFPQLITRHLRSLREPNHNDARWRQLSAALDACLRQCAVTRSTHRQPRRLRTYWNSMLAELTTQRNALRRQLSRDLRANDATLTTSTRRARQTLLASHPAIRSLTRRLKSAVRAAKAAVINERIGDARDLREWQALHAVRDAQRHTAILSPPFVSELGGQVHTTADKVSTLLLSLFPHSIPHLPGTPPHSTPRTSTFLPAVSPRELDDAIAALDHRKAAGDDRIPPAAVANAYTGSSIFRRRFSNLVNDCVRYAEFPDAWRLARIAVIPKPKPRNYTLPKSYRPISLLSIASKIVDSIVAARIQHAITTGLISTAHYGSLSGLSTTHAIATILEKARNGLRCQQHVGLATIDVGGAFDNIDHGRLCSRLHDTGQPALARWIAQWLSNRRFYITFEGAHSEIRSLGQRGVPQGSPLSPLLWVMYLDPFFSTQPTAPDQLFQGAYVDDLFAISFGSTAHAATLPLQTWIDALGSWCYARGLRLDKPAFSLHSPPEPPDGRRRRRGRGDRGMSPSAHQPFADCSAPTLSLPNGDTILPVPSVRLLGVTIGHRFYLSEHMVLTTQNVIRLTHMLQRNISQAGDLPFRARLRAAQVGLFSLLDYASPVLLPLHTKDRSHIARADSAILRLILGIRQQDASPPRAKTMAHELGLLTSPLRWLQQTRTFHAKLLSSPSATGRFAARLTDHSRPHSTDDIPCSRFDLEASFGTAGTDRASRYSVEVGPLRLLASFPYLPVEQCPPVTTPPWLWNPPSPIIPTAPKEEATPLLQRMVSDLIGRNQRHHALVFTDASCFTRNNHTFLGAAAVGRSVVPDCRWESSVALPPSLLTVFDAELQAIRLALDSCMANQHRQTRWKRIDVLSDSKAALLRISSPHRRHQRGGQTVVDDIIATISVLKARGTQVHLRWIPGHSDIEGNEAADSAARAAAALPVAVETTPAYSRATVAQCLSRDIAALAQQEWDKEARPSIKTLTPTFCASNIDTYADFPLVSLPLLAKWRANVIISHSQTRPPCRCGRELHDRDHVLLHCPFTSPPREALNRLLPPSERNTIAGLLQGGQFRHDDMDRRLEFLRRSSEFLQIATKTAWYNTPPRVAARQQREADATARARILTAPQTFSSPSPPQPGDASAPIAVSSDTSSAHPSHDQTYTFTQIDLATDSDIIYISSDDTDDDTHPSVRPLTHLNTIDRDSLAPPRHLASDPARLYTTTNQPTADDDDLDTQLRDLRSTVQRWTHRPDHEPATSIQASSASSTSDIEWIE